MEKTIASLTILTDLPEETIRELQEADLARIHTDVIERTMDLTPEFYPVFEMDGQLYGFADISSLSLGTYADLDRLTKDTQANVAEIMAILYRPILKHRFNSFEYAFKQSFKVKLGEAENIFKYYTLEKYDNKLREERAEVMEKIPASFALGALSFFLQVRSAHLIGSQIYLQQEDKKIVKKEVKEKIKAILSDSIGGGLQLFITSRQLPSLTSQEIKLLQI